MWHNESAREERENEEEYIVATRTAWHYQMAWKE
jgi:hypothetical protein